LAQQEQSEDTHNVRIPRALKTSRDVRREMVALYKQAKRPRSSLSSRDD
jgi:hypothetical protein